MKMNADVQAYSSIVGSGVLLKDSKGKMIGQIAFLCHADAMRDKETQVSLARIIADAINAACK